MYILSIYEYMKSAIIQKYIQNIDQDPNCPDEVFFFGKSFNMKYKYSYPFTYIQLPDENEPRFLIGEAGTYHRDSITNKIVEEYREKTNDDLKVLNKLFQGYVLDDYKGRIKTWGDKETAEEKAKYWGVREWIEDHAQSGRYFLISNSNINVCIFAFWSVWETEDEAGEAPDTIENGKLIKMVSERDNRINNCDYILVANNEKPYYVFKEELPDDYFKIGDNSEQHALHMMGAKEKHDNTADFRRERDELQGEKLGNMTMAQWNNMKYGYVAENKKHRRIFLSESQINAILKKKYNER